MTNTAAKRAQRKELERTLDRLTKNEAAEMLTILAVYFSLPVPHLRWTERARRAWAYPIEGIIVAGPRVWLGTTNALLHEFAHLLAYSRTKKHGHGKGFIDALHDVATAWHGDPARYAWTLEYKTVAATGPKPTN